MTSKETKVIIDDWIERYIRQTVDFRPGQKLSSARLNELFNLLILQGDDTTSVVKYIREYLTDLEVDHTSAMDNANAATAQTYLAIANAVEATNKALMAAEGAEFPELDLDGGGAADQSEYTSYNGGGA